MPTYEYACSACGHEFEREQRITEPPVKKCPGCGKMKARRMVGSGNFILKGGGWYADLYSSPGSKKEVRADATKSDTKTAEPKSDASKPASAPSGEGKATAPKGKTKATNSD